jgi:hypothetical protein
MIQTNSANSANSDSVLVGDDYGEYVPKLRATRLLERHGSTLTPREFHQLVRAAGLTRWHERPSTRHEGVIRRYTRLTDAGLRYGVNVQMKAPEDHSGIRFRADRFGELLELLATLEPAAQ